MAVGDEAPFLQDQYVHGLVDGVGDLPNAGAVLRAQIIEQRVHSYPGQGVKRAERFIGEQERGTAHERVGQRRPLLLTPGQLIGPGLRSIYG